MSFSRKKDIYVGAIYIPQLDHIKILIIGVFCGRVYKRVYLNISFWDVILIGHFNGRTSSLADTVNDSPVTDVMGTPLVLERRNNQDTVGNNMVRSCLICVVTVITIS